MICCTNDPWMNLYKTCVLFADPKFKMAATAEHSLTLGPMGKHVKCYILKTISYIKLILFGHGDMMVLYKIYGFSVDYKSKMATIEDHT